ncbi:hypothetical protein ACFO8L_14790 [Sphaerisporangium corydalis]|uniref:Uncharacterized protein n=1 Tax=Sphaerisporangium corydalis TaxID=1441875 RepID=A0ABV9EDD4_9ACTN
MSVTDIVRTIAKNVRQTVSDPSELKEKAKDLPLSVLQSALTGVGQALMLSDRIRTGIKRLLNDDDKDAPETRDAARPEAAPAVAEEPEPRPARREPVIFAPRPAKSGDSLNGATPKAETAVSAPAAAPAPSMRPAPAATPDAPAPTPAAAGPAPSPEAAATPDVTEATPAAKAGAAKPTAAKPAAPKAASAAKPAAARKPRAPRAPAKAAAAPAEPLPGYADLTMASLRARLRGRSADQIRELIAYEKATSARDDILQMYAKRLAKLEAEG